jgi:curved DNA-binding protein CbpA
MPDRDPYEVLGVSRGASDADVRAAYRRLAKLHHPDHNNGSEASEERFEEVQAAYARVVELRKGGGGSAGRRGASGPSGTGRRPASPPGGQAPPSDPNLDARMADLERELRVAQEARERARQAAREAAAAGADPDDLRQRFRRATDEELGYVRTEDTFSKILSDARDELSGRLSDAREHPVAKRVSDLISELEELMSKGTRGSKD